MSQRRVSWIEQNVEKVVMGVVGTVLLGVVGLQALYQPNKVKIGGGPETPPEDAYAPAVTSAKDLKGKTETSTPAPAPKVDLDLPKTLDSKFAKPIAPGTRVALGPSLVTKKVDPQGPVGNEKIAEFKVGAPTEVVGASLAAAIHPLEQVWHADLAALLPAQQPFDKVGVSVEGTFNGEALLAALSADPDGDGPIQSIPLGLWQDPMSHEVFVDIVRVELERELVRAAPGSTEAVGTKATIAGMPGRFDSMKFWNEHVHAKGDMWPAVQQLRSMAEQIERPAYYALIAGIPWEEPREMVTRFASGSDAAQISKLKSELSTAKDQLKAAEAALAALPPVGNTPPKGNTPPPPPPAGGGRQRPGGGGPTPPPRNAPPKAQDPAAIRQTAMSKVARLKGTVGRIEKQLSRLGADVAQPEEVQPGSAAAPAVSFFENDEVKLWAHDMTAQPGAAYRYRMRVVVNNPLFGASLIPEQQTLAANSLVYGEYSEWSEPVEVDVLSEFFITGASEAIPPASVQPSASAELYELYYGSYHLANVGVTPGDIFAAEIKVPELPIYDLPKLGAMFPEDKGIPGQAPAPGLAPAPGPGTPPRRLIAPGSTESPTPTPGTAKPENDGIARIDGAPFVLGKKSLVAGVASVFLDAQRLIVPGQTLTNQQREVVAAILRDPNGRIVARSPEADKRSIRYQRIQAYLKAEKLAKVPAPKTPTENQPVAPVEPAPRRDDRPGTGSGAGGGGGGGG